MYTITEKKSRTRLIPRKTLQITPRRERHVRNGSVKFQLWTGKRTGALEFFLSPRSVRGAAVVLAELREALPDANPNLALSEVFCESTTGRGSLQFSFREVNYRDQ